MADIAPRGYVTLGEALAADPTLQAALSTTNQNAAKTGEDREAIEQVSSDVAGDRELAEQAAIQAAAAAAAAPLSVNTLTNLQAVTGTSDRQRARVVADPVPPALTNPDGSNRNGEYFWDAAATAWVFDGPSAKALNAKTDQQADQIAAQRQDLNTRINVAPADSSSDVGGVPAQFLLVDPATGRGIILALINGRLTQWNGSAFEMVPTTAEVGSAATAAVQPVAGQVAMEQAARQALIDVQNIDFSVNGVPAQFVLVDLTTGRGMSLVLVNGRLTQWDGTKFEEVISRPELAAMLANITPAKITPTYDFSSGTSLSTPTYEPICYIIGAYGQSNSMGRNESGDALISTTPVYPQHALMMGSTVQALGTVQTTLNPLIETISNGGRETLLSGCVNHMIAAIDAAGLTRPHFIAFTAGQSGQPLTNLGRGSTGYTRWLTAVRNAADLARANGWRPVYLWAPFIQGENETDSTTTSAARHAARLVKLQRHMDEDARAITSQREQFGLMLVNTAHTAKTSVNRTTLTQHRIWEAFRALEGHPNFRMTGPMYQYPSSDVIHMNSVGQYNLGHQMARAMMGEKFGQGWTPVRDTGHRWISATQFEVDFALPRDGDTVTLDTSGNVVSVTGIPGYYGLKVVDGTASPPIITAHSITNGGYTNRTLRFTLDKAPGGVGGVLLCNGMIRNDAVDVDGKPVVDEQDGPLVGARSCIRTAAGTTSLQGVVNYDWCIPFVRNLGRP